MNKAEIIAYAIKKECQSYSLVDWCKEWGFNVDEFNRFLTLGQEAFYQEQTKEDRLQEQCRAFIDMVEIMRGGSDDD